MIWTLIVAFCLGFMAVAIRKMVLEGAFWMEAGVAFLGLMVLEGYEFNSKLRGFLPPDASYWYWVAFVAIGVLVGRATAMVVLDRILDKKR